MPDDIPVSYVREIGNAFRLGSGALGKSAIALAILLLGGAAAIFRLHSDLAIVGVFMLMIVVFFIWFFPVLRFCEKHPAAALLDGAEWTGYQRDQLAAKDYVRDPLDAKTPHISSGNAQPPIQIGEGL